MAPATSFRKDLTWPGTRNTGKSEDLIYLILYMCCHLRTNVTARSDTSLTGTNGASSCIKIRLKRENVYAIGTSIVAGEK